MALVTMYPGQFGSPSTSLADNIDSLVKTIPVTNAAVLPDAPNVATIGAGDTLEVILYTGKSGNNLTGVTRGFGGSAAQSWDSGEEIGRFYTTYDHNAFRTNIIDHVEDDSVHTVQHFSSEEPTPADGEDGDIWNVYWDE